MRYYVFTDFTIGSVLDSTKEILASFSSLAAAEHYSIKYRPVVVFVLSDRAREVMRAKKLGPLNPNAKGLTDEHREKIRRAMKRRRGEFHHMFGRKHRPTSKLKTSLTMKNRPKRRWCLDESGGEHLVLATFVLPEHWAWGRRRGTFSRL